MERGKLVFGHINCDGEFSELGVLMKQFYWTNFEEILVEKGCDSK